MIYFAGRSNIVEEQSHPVIGLTSELVRLNSENPINDESEVTVFITKRLTEWQIEYRLQEVKPGRQNIIATLKGNGEKPPLFYVAHMDTVPVGEGWSKEPLEASIENGKLYGRGAADMKGGLAAALYAIQKLKKEKVVPPGDLIVVATVDEEGPGMLGAAKLVEDKLIPSDALVIAPEPSNLEIVRVHKGVIWYELIAHGKMSHGGNADRGVDANHAIAEAIVELKTVVSALPFEHELVGRPMVSIGKMNGGEKTNVVPAFSRAEVDLRMVPPFSAEDANILVKRAVNRAVERVKGASIEVNNLGLQRGPVETPADSAVVRALSSSYHHLTGEEAKISGFTAYTDAGLISLQMDHKNSVVFGPGSLQQAHSVDEWIDVEQLVLCGEIFAWLAKERPE